jgi:hypothetical protein
MLNPPKNSSFLTMKPISIITRPVWELMNRLPMFKNAQCGDLSNAEWIAGRLVNIPSSVILK